jgi:heptosyltransferase II
MACLRDFSHIAIIQTAFIGDVALVLHLAALVRQVHPTARITLVTTPAGASFAQYCAQINNVVAFDKRGTERGLGGMMRLGQQLRSLNVDCVLAPHRSLRTAALVRLVHPDFSVTFSTSSAAWLYSRNVPYLQTHEIERNASLLSVFEDARANDVTIDLTIPTPTLHLPVSVERSTDALFGEHDIKPDFVAISSGSVWATKRWRVEHFRTTVEILRAHGKQVVLLGGKEDVELCHSICRENDCVKLAGKTSLPEMLAILKRASVLLCNDSAPTHLAGLVHCPTVTVFGPTVPAFGFAPRGEQTVVVENVSLPCRPCSPHGTRECPLGTHECMWSVEPERVVEQMVRLGRLQ